MSDFFIAAGASTLMILGYISSLLMILMPFWIWGISRNVKRLLKQNSENGSIYTLLDEIQILKQQIEHLRSEIAQLKQS